MLRCNQGLPVRRRALLEGGGKDIPCNVDRSGEARNTRAATAGLGFASGVSPGYFDFTS